MRQQIEQEMYALVEKYQESGMSLREFCTNEGVKVAKFQYWRNKYKKTHSQLGGFAKLEISEPVALALHIVIKLPNGTIIQIPL